MGRKVLLGILAWVPIALVVGLAIYIVVFLGGQLPQGGMPRNVDLGSDAVRHFAVALFGGASVIAVLQIIFSVAFIIDASSNAKLSGAPLALWALGFVFVGELVFPIYWLLYVKNSRAAPAPQPGHPHYAQAPHYGQPPGHGQAPHYGQPPGHGHQAPHGEQQRGGGEPGGRDVHGRATW